MKWPRPPRFRSSCSVTTASSTLSEPRTQEAPFQRTIRRHDRRGRQAVPNKPGLPRKLKYFWPGQRVVESRLAVMHSGRIMPRWDPNDAQLVVAAIGKKRLCVDCIIKKTGVTKARVDALMAMLGETLRVERSLAVCSACLIAKEVFRL